TKVLAEKRPSAKPVKLMVFHLRAVLPDRAWITSTSGETITVTIGDPIQDYGTVQAIDVQHGIIETSSGRKIEYGSNDY
ncbi:MAG: type IV secretion protein IcmG, partial [Gammaproteobacteria bacterium]|nr:type IV secretion protein IcmG [Gammaproteobacteria bacterium]